MSLEDVETEEDLQKTPEERLKFYYDYLEGNEEKVAQMLRVIIDTALKKLQNLPYYVANNVRNQILEMEKEEPTSDKKDDCNNEEPETL